MVIINVPSNIALAVYIIFIDVLAPIALGYFIAMLVASFNLKIIYDDRRVLCLQQLPFPLLFNKGVSTRLVGFAVAVSSMVIVILAISGALSINGVSQSFSEQQQVKYIVDRAQPNGTFDITEHVSEDEKHMSAEYLAIQKARLCLESRRSGIIIYSAFLDIPGVPESEWTESLIKERIVCRMENAGYEEKIAFSHLSMNISYKPGSCDFILNLPEEDGGYLTKVEARPSETCPFRLHDTWCARTKKVFCVGSVETSEGYTYMAKEYPVSSDIPRETLFKSGGSYFSVLHVDKEIPSQSIRSIAYLLGTRISSHPITAFRVSMLTVQRDGQVGRVFNSEKTEVNEMWFALTIAAIFLVLFGIAASALVSRYLYRVRLGRGNFNSFLSATDMLSCAINETHGIQNSTEKSYGKCAVKAVDGEPFLIELEQDHDTA